MEHIKNLTKDSENLKVLVKGEVTGRTSLFGKTVYQVDTETSDSFEVCEDCVFEDITKPVEVPQFVADWYEDNKDNLEKNIYDCIVGWGIHSSEIRDWMRENTPFQTLVNMQQFGYKVKKVDLYRVKLINGGQYLHTETLRNTYFTCVAKSVYSKEKLSDLGFDWVLDCPGIVLEEVE